MVATNKSGEHGDIGGGGQRPKNIQLTPQAITILNERYLQRDKEGCVNETPEEMFYRVAECVASAEMQYCNCPKKYDDGTPISCKHTDEWTDKFYEIMSSLKFLPNTPCLMNAGTNNGLGLFACFVLPLEDSLDDIYTTLHKTAKIFQAGGGVGYTFGKLRPEGSLVKSTFGVSSGPISFLKVFDASSQQIKQGGKRRGASMAIMPVDHPDIIKFITCKLDGGITNFNISVAITNDFMEAVQGNEFYPLIDPRTGTTWQEADEDLRKRVGNEVRINWQVSDGCWISAKDVFDLIVKCAWECGDPGTFFIDTVNNSLSNPVPNKYGAIMSSNPCLLSTTRMLTTEGLVRIKDIERTEFFTPEGWSYGRAWETGNKNVVNVVLSNGMSIITTPDHSFAVGEELVPALELQGSIEPFIGNGDWVGTSPLDDDNDYIRLGFIAGDGNRNGHTKGFTINLGRNDDDVRELFSTYKQYGERAVYVPASDNLVDGLAKLGLELLPTIDKYIPDQVCRLSPDSLCLFLKGLYSANGSVLDARYKRVTYKSVSLQLVRDIQLLLNALGIKSYITTNFPAMISWPNGDYTSKQSYDLNIAGIDTIKFRDKIGFVQQYKTDRLSGYSDSTNGRRILPKVIAVEPVGNAEVWDFSVSNNSHLGWANGFLVHNCSEQALYSNDSCNLGSINLSKFVFQDYLTIDWVSLRETIHTSVRFLDNVIDINVYPIPAIEEMSKNIRRIGLGVMGWADMLMMLGIPYDSDEALELADKMALFLRDESHEASRNLAMEKGDFPDWKDSVWVDTHYKNYDSVAHNSMVVRMRNSCVTTVAPTGTISLIAGCSSGIEPMFALVYKHYGLEGKIKDLITCKPFEDYLDSIVEQGALDIFKQAIAENNGSCQRLGVGDSEKVFVTARDISWQNHVKQQIVWQKYIDNGISKTTNMSNDATEEDIKGAYMMAWENGCKGITVFRDGSKDGILQAGTKDNVECDDRLVVQDDKLRVKTYSVNGGEPKSISLSYGGDTGYTIKDLEHNIPTVQYNKDVEVSSNFPSNVERPDVMQAVSIKQSTSYGNMYLNISEISPGQPYEVFITLGKSGNEFQALCELLGRMFSMWLKTAPEGQRDKALQDIITQSLGIGSVLANGIGEKKIYSISDAIGKGLQKYFTNNQTVDLGTMVIGAVYEQSIVDHGSDITFYKNGKPDNLPICPDCGASSVVYEEGCAKCYSCGFSKC